MNSIYIGDNKILVKTAYNAKLIVPSNDLSLTPDLALTGAIELPLTQFLINNVKPGFTVVDIGANIGYFTVLFGLLVKEHGKVYAYEANPGLYHFLFDNLSINYLHDRVSSTQKAVYSLKTNLTFNISERFMGNSSIHKHSDVYHKHYNDKIKQITVETIDLDSHLAELENINILKIDIEGGELHAFKGFSQLLKSNRIHTVIFELNREMLGDDWEYFTELLIELRDKYNKTFNIINNDGMLINVELEELLKLGGYPYIVMI